MALALPANSGRPGSPPFPTQLAPLAALPQLAALDFRRCLMGELPPPVASLPALRTLLLHRNRLKELPEGAYLANLERLDLSKNE